MRGNYESTTGWITAQEAALRLGCTYGMIRKLANCGKLKARLIPGANPQYFAADLNPVLCKK
jgi:hypothetical protein